MQRKQGGMETDRTLLWRISRRRGYEDVDKGHDHQVCLMRSHFIERRGVIEMRRLQDRQPVLESAGLYRIGRPGVLVRLAVDRHDLILAGSQNPRQRVLAERLLTHHD